MSDITAHRANAPPARNAYGPMCAEVYVLDKPPGSLDDAAYYREHLKGLGGPILEAASGSGRLQITLLEAGLDVQGFDRSEPMMDQCQAEAARRGLVARLSRQSFESFEYQERFAAIVCPVGAFTLIEDFGEALAVLKRFHAHLAPGGRLFVDLMPLSYLAQVRDSVRSWTTQEGDLLRIDSRGVELDWLAQRRVSHDRYERWRGGRLIEQELEILAVRCWGLREFEMALREAGFVDISVCGGYRVGRPLRPTDSWWCFQAVRAG
jgi:SAM-dependent methyltransferase